MTTWPAVTATPFKRKEPLVGRLSMRTAAKVCPPSASVNAKFAFVSVNVVSSRVVSVTLALSGGVLAPTVIATVLVAVPPFPSLIKYVMTLVPVTLVAGVKVKVPSPLTTTVPRAGGTVAEVMLRVFPSTSVSLPRTLMMTGAFTCVVAVSELATGLSLTEVTVTFTVAVATPPLPSVTV